MANAAGWLVSTIDDYWAFVHMILEDGVHDDRRILSADAVTRMCSDHLTVEQRGASTLFLGDDSGWGFGMGVPAAGPRRPGARYGFGWDGGTGTTWRSDTANDLTGILFTQRAMDSPEPPPVFTDFWDALYDAT
jgi:CubicO group peptidase (beta-lactamase class C family)